MLQAEGTDEEPRPEGLRRQIAHPQTHCYSESKLAQTKEPPDGKGKRPEAVMDTKTEESARMYAHSALTTINRAAEIIENASPDTNCSGKQALAEADRELRAKRNGQAPGLSLQAIENALNRHLRKTETSTITPLDGLSKTPTNARIAELLRLTAPDVANGIAQRILTQEMALEKLAASGVTDEEADKYLAEARGK